MALTDVRDGGLGAFLLDAKVLVVLSSRVQDQFSRLYVLLDVLRLHGEGLHVLLRLRIRGHAWRLCWRAERRRQHPLRGLERQFGASRLNTFVLLQSVNIHLFLFAF